MNRLTWSIIAPRSPGICWTSPFKHVFASANVEMRELGERWSRVAGTAMTCVHCQELAPIRSGSKPRHCFSEVSIPFHCSLSLLSSANAHPNPFPTDSQLDHNGSLLIRWPCCCCQLSMLFPWGLLVCSRGAILSPSCDANCLCPCLGLSQ